MWKFFTKKGAEIDDQLTSPVRPAGTILMHGSSVAPSGWLICNGGLHPAASYPDLYTVIGTTYGGFGANFNVPNLSTYFPRGTGTTGLNGTGGANTHNHTVNTHSHTIGDHTHSIPSHTHSIPAHTHAMWHHFHTGAGYTIPQIAGSGELVSSVVGGHRVALAGHQHQPNNEGLHGQTAGIFNNATANTSVKTISTSTTAMSTAGPYTTDGADKGTTYPAVAPIGQTEDRVMTLQVVTGSGVDNRPPYLPIYFIIKT